jgi:hypothetical protein
MNNALLKSLGKCSDFDSNTMMSVAKLGLQLESPEIFLARQTADDIRNASEYLNKRITVALNTTSQITDDVVLVINVKLLAHNGINAVQISEAREDSDWWSNEKIWPWDGRCIIANLSKINTYTELLNMVGAMLADWDSYRKRKRLGVRPSFNHWVKAIRSKP